MEYGSIMNEVQIEESASKGYFDTRYTFDPLRKAVWRAIVENLQRKFISTNSHVLELGCGYGDFINQVVAEKKLAIDIEDVHKLLDKRVIFFNQDVTQLDSIDDNTLDIVFASNLLEHLDIDNVSLVLSEVFKKLKSKGKIILLQPNFRLCYKNYFDDYTHRTAFTDESLSGILLAHGFNIKYRKPGYLPFSMQGVLPKSYWLTRMYLSLGSPIMGTQMLIVGIK